MQVGKHEVTFEQPDIIRLRVVGKVAERDADGIVDAVASFAVGRPHLLWLIDLTEAGAIGGDARRRLIERLAEVPNRGAAFVGGSFAVRLVAKMAVHAAPLFTRRRNPVGFFEAEEPALAWIAAERRKLAAA
jgi:hypothetical protein